MINLSMVTEMVGMTLREKLEIEQYGDYLEDSRAYFFDELNAWLTNFDFEENDTGLVFKDTLYSVLISGHHEENFFIAHYHQALSWHRQGLKQSRVMLLLSQCRQLFIYLSEKKDNSTLARALCHSIDLGQAIVSAVYQMHETMAHMKQKSTAEVARMRRSFQLIAASAPEDLIQAFIDHQDWKIRAYSLALGEIEEGDFPYSTHECRLGKWLDNGGWARIPEKEQTSFNLAHEQVHRLGAAALKEAREHHPERIVDFLIEMEFASDEVSRVLLDRIEEEFVKAATLDALTSLPNRRAFDMKLKQDIAFAKRHNFWIGLLVIDVDHFKNVNDQYGHAIGDQVLKGIARVLEQAIRQEDSAFRWGGEEFAVLCLEEHSQGAEALAERIRKLVEETVFCEDTETSLNITVSLGCVSLHPQFEILEHELFGIVDKQLYNSKHGGRNQVSCLTLEAE